VANGRLDVDSPVTLMAELGHGLFGAPGIEGHRQGLDGSPVFATAGVVQDGQSLTIISEDRTPGCACVAKLCSIAAACSAFATVDQPARAAAAGGPACGHAAGCRTRPRSDGFSWPLDPRVSAASAGPRHDSFVLENRRGRTSHEHFPALITGSTAFSEMQGEVWEYTSAGAATTACAPR
jgi:alpha-galactosidase